MSRLKEKIEKRERRRRRVRAKVFGTSDRPRLSVFRSNRHIYAQLIDDTKERTLAQAWDGPFKSRSGRSKKVSGTASPIERARRVGALIAERSRALKISRVMFDRGPYAYHGAVKALAEGAREGGLKF